MQLTPVMEKFIVHWGEMGTRWGVNRTVAQIHALLYLSVEPLDAEEISTTLGVARSNVSNSLKELTSWGLARVVHVMGDRRDHFVTMADVWDIFDKVMEERKKREIMPTLALLRECELEAEADKDMPSSTRKRISEMKTFLETLTEWHDQMQKVPRNTLLKLMKLGGKITKLLTL
jgi:DNA-binding transcriptional regulator GbsR (MarR family)